MTNIRLGIFLLFLTILSCASQKVTEKINGVNFVASRSVLEAKHTKPIIDVNANYAAIMPFGFIGDLSNPKIHYNSERQWYGETLEGAQQYIEELKASGIAIMLKPQLWVRGGEYTGFITMTSETDWKTLEDSYRGFILEYAVLAEDTKCEIFCVGTELEKFISERPYFWNKLIGEIKNVYSGKLTYAANWDEYKRTPFWDELDYIGLDAYFPLSESKTPTLAECKKGWANHKIEIENISSKFDKPILFTEFGYRSVDFTAKEPWKSDRSMNQVNMEAQANALRSLLETFWGEPWFAGGFVWKWFIAHHEVGGVHDSLYTPQNKPAETVLQEFYSSF